MLGVFYFCSSKRALCILHFRQLHLDHNHPSSWEVFPLKVSVTICGFLSPRFQCRPEAEVCHYQPYHKLSPISATWNSLPTAPSWYHWSPSTHTRISYVVTAFYLWNLERCAQKSSANWSRISAEEWIVCYYADHPIHFNWAQCSYSFQDLDSPNLFAL